MTRKLTGIFLICMMMLLCGCGGLQQSQEIQAVGLFSGNRMELSVPNRQYSGPETDGVTYSLDRPWKEEDFRKQAEQFGEVQTLQNGYVLFADQGVDTYDAFYFPFRRGEQMVTNMSVNFVFDETQAEEQTTKALVQIPLHLVADERLTSSVQPKLYAGIEYEMLSDDVDAFLEFYQHTGWYQAEKTSEGTVILSGYRATPERELLEDATFDVPFPLTFHFTEHYGMTYVSIS
ncbi:MAG: hypothetical protein Q4D42_01315 [Eubacteriales bacterium]|nr:hypothetical protein [Eubacteriales bacterium]